MEWFVEVRFAAAPVDKPTAYYRGDVMRVSMLGQQEANMAVAKLQAGRDGTSQRMAYFLDRDGFMWVMDSWRVVYARAGSFDNAPPAPAPAPTPAPAPAPVPLPTQEAP